MSAHKPSMPAGYRRKLFIDRGRAAQNKRESFYMAVNPQPCIAMLDEGNDTPLYAYAVEILGPSKFCHDVKATATPAAWIETDAELILTMEVAL